jgi:hypothetical protein
MLEMFREMGFACPEEEAQNIWRYAMPPWEANGPSA